jgi:hypothetical protein
MRPFGSRVCPPPLQHAPVRARAQCRTRPRPDTCPHRNGCTRLAFRPCEDTVFAPGPIRLRPFTRDYARRLCAHSRGRAKSPRAVPRVRAHPMHPRPAPCVRAWSLRPAPLVRARSYLPAPISTRSCPLAHLRAQRGHAFTSGRTWATNARPQSFPVGAPCSRVRPQHYINPFAPLHKSLCS